MLAELGRAAPLAHVRIPASKIWTPTEDQTIPPLAVAKIGRYSSSNAIPETATVRAWHVSTGARPVTTRLTRHLTA
jgi:hypothetical protein